MEGGRELGRGEALPAAKRQALPRHALGRPGPKATQPIPPTAARSRPSSPWRLPAPFLPSKAPLPAPPLAAR